MSPRRYELSDFEWSIIEPLLPNKPRGVKRSDDRKVLNGIYWRLRRARRGRRFPTATGLRRPATIALYAGPRSASGIGYSKRSQKPTMATCK